MLFASVSGAHLNPAVTLGPLAARRFPAQEVPPYVLAQTAGAFAGSFAVLLLLGASDHWGAALPHGGDVFLVFPLEAGFTLALVGSVLWLSRPSGRPSLLALLLPAAVVGVSAWLIGPWTGSSLNPARSLAPAVLSLDFLGPWAYLRTIPAAAILGGWLEKWAFASRQPESTRLTAD